VIQAHGVLQESQAGRDQRETKERGATLGYLVRKVMRVFKEFQAFRVPRVPLDPLACWEELDILVLWEQRVTRAVRDPLGDPDHLDHLVYNSMKEME